MLIQFVLSRRVMLKGFALIGALSLVTFLYWPYLASFLIFDDLPNLGGLSHIQKAFSPYFWHFVTSGESSITGRPIALFTFALQFAAWPDQTFALKLVNLLIHLINMLLVFVLFWQLFNVYLKARIPELPAFRLALLLSLIWAIHPIHVNAVLYLVQRMTLLSATFMLLALNAYILAQANWLRCRNLSLGLLALAWGIFPAIGFFTKENAVLVYFYMAVLTYFIQTQVPKSSAASIPMGYLGLGIGVPCCLLIGYLTLGFAHWLPVYELRDFTLGDRLLTQSRVLWSYIYAILKAPLDHFTLLGHDVYPISRSLTAPLSTLIAVCAWVLVFVGLVGLKRVHKGVFTLCVLSLSWFFSGHVLESTTLALEIYFDHRNYLASLGVIGFLLLGVFFLFQIPCLPKWFLLLVYGVIFIFYYMASVSNASLWKHPFLMAKTMVYEHPKSPRANIYYMTQAERARDFDLLQETISGSEQRLGFNALVELFKIKYMCVHGLSFTLHPQLFEMLSTQVTDRWASVLMKVILNEYERGACPLLDEKFMLTLLESLHGNESLSGVAHEMSFYLATYWGLHNDTQRFKRFFSKSLLAGGSVEHDLLAARYALKQENALGVYYHTDNARDQLNEFFVDPSRLAQIKRLRNRALNLSD